MRWPLLVLICVLILGGGFTGQIPAAFSTAPDNAPAAGPVLEGCPVFPADNVWNTPVDTLPLDPQSATYIQIIGANDHFHADFGSGTWDGFPIGIPYNVVAGSQPKVSVIFDYTDESDPGPYPIPANPNIEGDPASGDRHILILDKDNCLLYELYNARKSGSQWYAGSGAIFDLHSHALRPETWTSADAAGLAILPGLVRYQEVAAGEIQHAIRFTVSQTRRAYIWPARHYASSLTGGQYPPMGLRLRLKASFDITPYPPQSRVVLQAMKKYGILLADNGSDWYLSGAPDESWDNDDLHSLQNLPGSAFEVVYSRFLMVSSGSGQALIPNFRYALLPFLRR
jgi:hypothetical protein